MCGFFAFSTGMSAKQLADRFELSNPPKNIQDIQSLKFAPKMMIPTISKNSPNKLVLRRWSLIPRWWRGDPDKIKFSTFNARVEEIANKPSYRAAWRANQRCLIPASWFYEFERIEVPDSKRVIKKPYRVEVSDESVITLAGLYEIWTDGQRTIESCTMLTQPAVEPLRAIHNRQPVIIPEKYWNDWLSPKPAPVLQKLNLPLIVKTIPPQFNRTNSQRELQVMLCH